MAATQMSTDNSFAHSDMDYREHLATYRLFTSLVKWGTAAIVVFLVLLAFFTL